MNYIYTNFERINHKLYPDSFLQHSFTPSLFYAANLRRNLVEFFGSY